MTCCTEEQENQYRIQDRIYGHNEEVTEYRPGRRISPDGQRGGHSGQREIQAPIADWLGQWAACKNLRKKTPLGN
jgi:hypothetical protein